MADMFTKASFAFTRTPAEFALLEEAFRAAHDLSIGAEPEAPSPALLAAFPPTEADAPWGCFRDAMPDPDFPSLGAEVSEGGVAADPAGDPGLTAAWIHGMTDFQPVAVAIVVQRCCAGSLARAPIGFEWAMTCSKPRLGEFGGGWCAIFADRIDFETTAEPLAAALAVGAA